MSSSAETSKSAPAADAASSEATEAASPKADDTTSPPGDVAAAETLQPADHWVAVAEQDADDAADDDSAFGDLQSSTASLSSSILAYRTINGRRYHAEKGNANYWASNDEAMQEAHDIHHHSMLLGADMKLHFAPLSKDIKTALDIGCGTGAWALDFADEYPDCEVRGTDISPIQPSWVPPNLKFEIEDCTDYWTFPENSQDFVHMRLLYGSIADWSALFREAYRVTKPGGWVESREATAKMFSDYVDLEGTALGEWGKFYYPGGDKTGRTFRILEADIQQKCMEEAGFVDIQVWDNKIPVGGWSEDPKRKEIGQYCELALQDAEGYVNMFAKLVAGWEPFQVSIYCARLRKEVRQLKYRPYYKERAVWGRKPE